MNIQKIKINQIKLNPNNPRLIKDQAFFKMVKSIKEFPKMLGIRPIVVNDDMIVLGGNMRLKACIEAGLKEVPVIKASELSEEEQRRFIIADNVGYGEWDWELLANTWDNEQLNEWGLEVPIFDNNDIDNDINDLSSTINNLYRIEIICKDEEQQENTYNKLIEQGYECRLLTL